MDSIAAAKIISIPTAFFVAGYSFSFSQNTVPLLYKQAASVATPVFSGVFYQGAAAVAPCSVLATTANAYLAYSLPRQRKLWTIAAGLTLFALPFTQLVMSGGINRLLEIAKSVALQAKADQSGEVERLLRTWVLQNWVRTFSYFSGGVVGLYAVAT